MDSWTVNQDFAAEYGEQRLVLRAGSTVQLAANVAAWVNRASPGTLEPASKARPKKGTTRTVEGRTRSDDD